MSNNFNREAHRQFVDDLFERDGVKAFDAHRRTCPLCLEEENPRSLPLADGAAGPLHIAAEPSTTPAEQWPNIPGYQIKTILGRGGMGVVYKAWDVELQLFVALKVIRSDKGRTSEEWEDAVARLLQEARAAAQSHHQNIVHVYRSGKDPVPFIAMELVEGGTLQDLMKKNEAWGERDAAEMVATLAEAVHCAHRRGAVHRDLKPSNVLIAQDGTPKITDFGCAKGLAEKSLGLTSDNKMLGTPCYMSPEQAGLKSNGARITPRSDVFSLGIMFYELLTGRLPFEAPDGHAVANQILTMDPRPPRELQPTLAPEIEKIVLKALQKKPAERYATAAELAQEIRRALKGKFWQDWRNRMTAVSFSLNVALTAVLAAVLYFGADWDARKKLGEQTAKAEQREQELSERSKVLDQTKQAHAEELRKERERLTKEQAARLLSKKTSRDGKGRIVRGLLANWRN